MATIYRRPFGRPCYDGCGATVPTQRVDRLRAVAEKRGDTLPPFEIVCVDCAKRRGEGAVVTRRR